MMARRSLLSRFRKAERGSTAIETAIVLPVFLLLALGTFDLGYLMYNRSMLSGMLTKAARDSTIESNIGAASAIIDKRVRDALLVGANSATVTFKRTSFADFASAGSMEPFSDGNNNQTCDNNEAFEDQNNSGKWDNGGRAGQGGAKDVVVYKVDLKYPRLMPMAGFLGWENDVKLSAQTVVSNQPYAEQQQRTTTMGKCK